MRISDYDKFDYEYSTYWKARQYEHLSETNLLKRYYQGEKSGWIIDIGGSYGRLLKTYKDNYKNQVIIDYSLKTLQNNYETLTKEFPNLHLIAANVYHLPFKDEAFDSSLMVRVLHHIEDPQKALSEIARVLKSKAMYVQEFANKIHIKARLKAILRGDFKFFTEEPYQQPTTGKMEGSEGVESVFLNFHPRFIKGLLVKNNFKIKGYKGVSYLRIPLLKKILGSKLLILFEKILQTLFSGTSIAPSIFVKATLVKQQKNITKAMKIKDILCCPSCKGDLSFNYEKATCSKCSKTYKKCKNIWDFRINES